MYQVKPIVDSHIPIDLPTCMYSSQIHAQHGDSCTAEHALQNGEVGPAVKTLEARQDEIMRKLYELKATVDGLAKIVTTPDADLDVTVTSSLSPQSFGSTVLTSPTDLDTVLGKSVGALRDIVVNANPARPPLSLLVLHGLLCKRYRVLSSVHVHSSVPGVPPQLVSCLGPRHPDSYARHMFQLGFTLIWKDVPKVQMKFSIQNMCPIEGEASVARFLYKLLAPYPSEPAAATLVDSWVDTAFFQLAGGSSKEQSAVLRALNSALGRSPWVAGSEFSLADVACYCCVLRSGSASAAPANVQRWIKSCENLGHFKPAKLLQ